MLVKEYRITLPMSVDQYKIGQLYTTCRMSKSESGGGEGVEILKSEDFYGKKLFGEYDSGLYTSKMYYLKEKLPLFVRLMAPDSCVKILEESWDAYPYCRTTLTNEEMKNVFFILVESLHLDGPREENAHKLDECRLGRRDVVEIDIANDPVFYEDYDPEEDPKLGQNWKENTPQTMTSYKLLTCSFEWFGLQDKVENLVHKIARRLFLVFHRKMYSWMDEWKGLAMDDIRNLEERTAVHLDMRREAKYLQGMKFP